MCCHGAGTVKGLPVGFAIMKNELSFELKHPANKEKKLGNEIEKILERDRLEVRSQLQ